MTTLTRLFALAALMVAALPACAQHHFGTGPTNTSGGVIIPEQAAYDVTFYDLALTVDPDEQRIDGRLTAHADVVHPLGWFVLDLDTTLTVRAVDLVQGDDALTPLAFRHEGGKIWADLRRTRQPGEQVAVRVTYGGTPKVAPNPPWIGGFTWAETEDGQSWIATSVQEEGADLWWPCKDYPSDEPDSMALHITVPEPLVVASNGRLRDVQPQPDGSRTYNWFVSTPINNYGVALNIAPYRVIERTFTSITGEEVPAAFWVLPERYEEAQERFGQFLDHVAFYEKYLGPYPFRADKFGVAHTPFLGMEHQTIIAYGSDFTDEGYGFDWLLHHELGHEWWGNLVTAYDWRDFWIHEGFCTYMQALYAEDLFGEDAYFDALARYRGTLRNERPVAPRESRTTTQMYFADVATGQTDNDIYYKGSWVLHTLRYLIGDDAFFTALRRMAYPTPRLAEIETGEQCRFVSTDDFVQIAEEASGRELDWFFEVYVRQPELPVLTTDREGATLNLAWDVPGDRAFEMPVDVRVDGVVRRVEMPGGEASVDVPANARLEIDPKGWILRAE